MENLIDDKYINGIWDKIKENLKTSAKENLGLHELKQRKLWFDEKCLGFLDQRKQFKMHWIIIINVLYNEIVHQVGHLPRDVLTFFKLSTLLCFGSCIHCILACFL